MKKGTIAFVVVVVAVAVVALAGCGGGSGAVGARLIGRVADTAGVPIEGVAVSLATNPGVSATTNSNGVYSLRGVPTGPDFIVRYRKAGFAESQAIGSVQNGRWSTMDVLLFREGRAANVGGAGVSTVSDARGDGLNAKVVLPAQSIVDSTGAPVASAVVSITTGAPTDQNFKTAYPSSNVGRPTGLAGDVPLIPHGAVNVVLKDSAGNILSLDPTKPATLEFPVTAGHDPGTPTVPMWTLNTATGKWVQEGVATRDNSVVPAVYRGQVTHFSWWAINTYPSTTHYIIVKVVEDPTVSPMVPVCGAMVRVRSDRGSWQARGITSTQGVAGFIAPPPGPYWVEAKLDYYEDKGVYSVTTNGNVTEVLYWLRPSSTGAPGGCPDCD
ncbi:MAG: carboxypeptidase regulatory-like domain-containing protein [Armatimonadetes bacterium]|nr:carboxypeptidase regulatory-like domain-containing protein [Armatimonadota bacterium]